MRYELLILSWTVLLLQIAGCSSSNMQFVTVALCPNASRLPGRVEKSRLLCGAACARNLDCDLFHFNSAASLCYLGNSSCGLALWAGGPCVSYKPVRRLADPIASQLDLKMLYRFATHGLVNAADPSTYLLRGGTATINCEGANFVKSTDSYLMTDTAGFESVVNKGYNFSVFVRAKHALNTRANYLTFYECGGSSVGGDLYVWSGVIYYDIFCPADAKSYTATSGAAFASSSLVSVISIGATYSTDHYSTFYFNGSVVPAQASAPKNANNLQNSFYQCMLLGGFPGFSQYSVDGSISCFALSTRVLTQAEFIQLDRWCQRV